MVIPGGGKQSKGCARPLGNGAGGCARTAVPQGSPGISGISATQPGRAEGSLSTQPDLHQAWPSQRRPKRATAIQSGAEKARGAGQPRPKHAVLLVICQTVRICCRRAVGRRPSLVFEGPNTTDCIPGTL